MISKDDKLLSRLQALCSRKEYCSSEMYRKALKGLDGDEEGAAQMLQLLVADKYVDDLRYATAFARDKSSLDGWGPIKISFALKGKGIDAATVAGALAAVDPEKSGDKLRSILESKYRMLKGCGDVRLKLLKFALARGYQYDGLDALVREIMSDGQS